MKKTTNIKLLMLMGIAGLVMGCGNKKKQNVQSANFYDCLTKEKVANGYDTLARENTDTTVELEQIEDIYYANSLAGKIQSEFEKSALSVVLDCNRKIKSVLKRNSVAMAGDIIRLDDCYFIMMDNEVFSDWSGAMCGDIQELIEKAGIFGDKEDFIIKNVFQSIQNAKSRLQQIRKSIESKYTKSRGIRFIEWPGMGKYLRIEQVDSINQVPEPTKLSAKDAAKLDSLWNVICRKREIEKKKDSLLNEAWIAANEKEY